MRKLYLPQGLPSPIDAVDQSLPAAKKLSTEERLELTAAFDNYCLKLGRSDMIRPDVNLNRRRGDDFRAAYKQTYKNKKLHIVRTTIRKLASNKCCCCGGSRPNHLDHHLPKETFGEFAVFIFNLVPYCSDCNPRKHTHASMTEAEAFLHPYFDPIPDTPYISVSLNIAQSTIVAELRFDDSAAIGDHMIKARMKHQFETIGVNECIEDEISELIEEYCLTISDEYGDATAEEVKTFLERRAEKSAEQHGKGSWRAAVLHALGNNLEFCNGGFRAMLPKKSQGTRPVEEVFAEA